MTINSIEDLENATNDALVSFYEGLLRDFGLSGLGEFVADAAMKGLSESEFITALEGTDEYRTQFAPIFERRALGLPPVTPLEVLNYRRQVAQLGELYEIPDGVLDADAYLVGDVSYNELQQDLAFAANLRDAEDPEVVEELLGMGVTEGAILAYALNPDAAMTAMQEQLRIAGVTVGARRGGFNLTAEEAAMLEDRGGNLPDIQRRAAALTNAGDIAAGVGGEFGGLDRQTELGVLAGDTLALRNLEDRAQRLGSRFAGGGSFQRTREGVTGLGSA